MKLKIKIICLVIFFGVSTIVYSKPWSGPSGTYFIPPTPTTNVVIQQIALDANNINSFFYSSGIMDQDLKKNDWAGFEWPKYSGQCAIFTSGLSTGCYINGSLHEAMCSYKGEYEPGYVDNSSGSPVPITDSRFRIYRIYATDNNSNSDYANWGDMVPFGAPYIDVNHNNQYDPGIDKPGIVNASETLFGCLTDGFQETHQIGEGFGGGTAPLYAEMHMTAWCYNTPGLEDIQFVNWVVINKNKYKWEKVYMGVTTDPDLGCANDDYIGCDTSLNLGQPRNLGYVWNGEDIDCAAPVRYNGIVPCAGMAYFRSPIVYTGNNNDSVVYYVPPGATDPWNKHVKRGWKQLGLTSFDYFVNTSTASEPCVHDPNGEPVPAYYLLQGIKKDQTPWVFPPGGSANYVTKFCYPGDPETGKGWCEADGSPSGAVWNCGGPNSYSGTYYSTNVFGDRRYIFNSGADNYSINSNDTENIVLAQMIALGSSRKNSVTMLKKLDDVAQKIFNSNFNVIPPPPPPNVRISADQLTSSGTYALTLSWSDTSEYYNFWDTLFAHPSDSSFYRFEGYEVWEVDRTATTLPDFTKPETINNTISLIAIFDKVDTVGAIVDTFSTGNGTYGVFPVVPPYKMPTPPGFPNSGISRSITLNQTLYPANNNNSTNLIYGHDYEFVITAYAYNTHQKQKGLAIIRNSIPSSVLHIHIEAPVAGSQFFYHNGDTINTNRRDLGVMPIVKAQELLQDAKYRIQFNKPDTSYNILRSFNNWATWDVPKSNLRYSFNPNPNADDSARIIDGIDFKVFLVRGGDIGGGFDTGNVGVVKDPTDGPVLTQTRYNGWDYFPPGNRYLEGSKYLFSISQPWQSKSMSISYPNRSTYVGLPNGAAPTDLRNVELVFTDTNNGQYSYRYLKIDATHYTYQDMKKVPFTAWEIDSTDGTNTPRQVDCAFLEFPVSDGGHPDGVWQPYADSLGGLEILYIFNSNYSTTPNPNYTTKNLFLNQGQFPILYVWSPKLINPGAKFHVGDRFVIYPYMVTQPEIAQGYPLYYEIVSKKPIIGDPNLAKTNNDLNKITIVPNPYYGFNNLETPQSGHYVAFRRLPVNCTIKIYTLNGDLIQTLKKNDATTSELRWNMMTFNNVPVASGIYICLIDAPGIGQKVLKAAIFTVEERIDF